nr:tyrosine-type recombinase/integrase [uncultured Cohaesibacter sp.]
MLCPSSIEDTRLATNRDGYFEIRWTERTDTGRARTRTYSCGTKDANEAKAVRVTWFAAQQQVAQQLAVESDPTISSLIKAYTEQYIDVEGVNKSQRFSLRIIDRYLGNYLLSEITPDAIIAHRKTREAEGIKPGTVRRQLGAFRAVLNWAKDKGKLIPESYALPKFDLPEGGGGRTNVLSEDEEERMWKLASELALSDTFFHRRRIGYFICIALETAARSEAIETLTWDRVHLNEGLLDFRDPDRRATKKRRVPVPISDRLLPILTDLSNRERKDNKYVLGSSAGTDTSFRRFRDQHGFNSTRHDLRRTWATLRAQWGVSLTHIADVLGDTYETVEKHYKHLQPEYLRSAMNARPNRDNSN